MTGLKILETFFKILSENDFSKILNKKSNSNTRIYIEDTKSSTCQKTVLRGNKGQANKGQISFSKKIYSGRIRDKYWEKNFNRIKYCRFFIFTFYLSVRKKSVIWLCLTFFSFTAGIVQISETSSSLLSSSFWKSSIISFSISICRINSSSTSAFSNSWSKSKSVVSLVFSQALRIVSFSVVQILFRF